MISFFIVIGLTAPPAVLGFIVGLLVAGSAREGQDEATERDDDPRWVSLV